jgi:hypothetical protein
MLLDVLMLIAGLALLLIGLQNFFEREKRKSPTEVLRSTTTMVTGLFLVYVWYKNVSILKSSTSYI